MTSYPFEITSYDIETASLLRPQQQPDDSERPLLGRTPACVALERLTGSRWKTVGALMLREECAPFRLGVLPADLTSQLEEFLLTGRMEPSQTALILVPSAPRQAQVVEGQNSQREFEQVGARASRPHLSACPHASPAAT